MRIIDVAVIQLKLVTFLKYNLNIWNNILHFSSDLYFSDKCLFLLESDYPLLPANVLTSLELNHSKITRGFNLTKYSKKLIFFTSYVLNNILKVPKYFPSASAVFRHLTIWCAMLWTHCVEHRYIHTQKWQIDLKWKINN